jgi:thymidine kinase
MKKLQYKYGSMSAGKSLQLLVMNHSYNELGLTTIVVVPDCINSNVVRSRVGIKAQAIPFSMLKECIDNIKIDCVLVDEAQFLTKEEVEYLSYITLQDIQVIAYGLRTTFKGELFEGSKWLLALADVIEEIPTLCNCGSKARMNIRLVDGKLDKDGDTMILREDIDVSYISVCRKCHYEYYNGLKDVKHLLKFDNTISCK